LTVAFETAVDITDDDVNGVLDVYLYDLAGSDLLERASVAIPGGTDATGTRFDGHTGFIVPQINGHDAAVGWSGLDIVFNSNGDLADDRPVEEEEPLVVGVAPKVDDTTTTTIPEVLSTEPAVFTRTRVLNPSAPDPGFADVPSTHLFYDPIAWAVDQHLAVGYTDGLFHPSQVLTRQAAAAMLWRLAGAPAGPFPNPGFTDVPATSVFATPIAWAADAGVVGGYPDGTFRPTNPVTRGAFSALLYRFAERPPAPFPAPGYTDVSVISTFYTPIAWATANGIVGGYADGTFRPGTTVSRQVAVTLLYGFVPVAAVS
jgi:hypothetical protein